MICNISKQNDPNPRSKQNMMGWWFWRAPIASRSFLGSVLAHHSQDTEQERLLMFFTGALYELTNRRTRSTERPLMFCRESSTRLATTTIRSKMFQPERKNSLLMAITFSVHSKVKMDVNTWQTRKQDLMVRYFFQNTFTRQNAFTR